MSASLTQASLRSRRARLLAGCALAGAIGTPAVAQRAFQATPTNTVNAVVDQARAPNLDVVIVTAPQAIIDWTPDAGTGTINILPQGSELRFQVDFADQLPSYTILNRINPADASRAVKIDGFVNSMVDTGYGISNGAIWFYSPGGIIAGANSRFDVGSLVLSANAIQVGDFVSEGLFAGQSPTALAGTIQFRGGADSRSFVTIEAGAKINAASSYVALVAPRVTQGGLINVNGSAALVAAESADITIPMAGSLFDIAVTVGSKVDTPGETTLDHSGTTYLTDPGQTNDARRVYLVAVPKNDAITLLLSNKAGYDSAAVAQQASSGAIILAAGEQATVTSDDSVFVMAGKAANVGFAAATLSAPTSVAATGAFELDASAADTSIAGGLIVDAGTASVRVENGSSLTVGGDLRLTSKASGAGSSSGVAGSATGGAITVDIRSKGSVSVTGDMAAESHGFGGESGYGTGGDGFGGAVTLRVESAGALTVGGLVLNSFGTGGSAGVMAGGGTGGSISLTVDGGSVEATTGISSYTLGEGGLGFGNGTGGDGQSGSIAMSIRNEGSLKAGSLEQIAEAIGGASGGGIGGTAAGRDTSLTLTNGASLTVGQIVLQSAAFGGEGGTAGGDAVSGQSLVSVLNATIDAGGESTSFIESLASGGGGGVTSGTGVSGRGAIEVIGATAAASFGGQLFVSAEAYDSGEGSNPGVHAIGGTADLFVFGGKLDAASLSLLAAGTGGDSETGRGGSGTGGTMSVVVNAGGTVTAGALEIEGTGRGGRGAFGGGDGRGGTALIDIDGGAFSTSIFNASSVVRVDGVMGHGSGAASGSGAGGAVTLKVGDDGSDLYFGSGLQIKADAYDLGGGSSVGGGGAGGTVSLTVGTGGFEAFNVEGTGLLVSASGRGSFGQAATGDGKGGTIAIVSKGGTITTGDTKFVALGTTVVRDQGDPPVRTLVGGSGTGGAISFDLANSIATMDITADVSGEGGDGSKGAGIGKGGRFDFVAKSTELLFDLTVVANGVGGGAHGSLDGLALGADGIGGAINVSLADTVLSGPNGMLLDAEGTGGGADTGGIGKGGAIAVAATDGTVLDGSGLSLSTRGFGGNGQSEGGAGVGGDIAVTARLATIDLFMSLETSAQGGEAYGGATSSLTDVSEFAFDGASLAAAEASFTGPAGRASGGSIKLLSDQGGRIAGHGEFIAVNTGGDGFFGSVGGDAVGGSIAFTAQGGAFEYSNGIPLELMADGVGGYSSGSTLGTPTARGGTVIVSLLPRVSPIGTDSSFTVSGGPAVLSANARILDFGSSFERPDGGTAVGGTATLVVESGSFKGDDLTLTAAGTGGAGPRGAKAGTGYSGRAGILQLGGTIELASNLIVSANATGGLAPNETGYGIAGSGGNANIGDNPFGTGAGAFVDVKGGSLSAGNVSVTADAIGRNGGFNNGSSSTDAGDGGAAKGGTAAFSAGNKGDLTIGSLIVSAVATGGSGGSNQTFGGPIDVDGGNAGTAQGGVATVFLGGSTQTVNQVQAFAFANGLDGGETDSPYGASTGIGIAGNGGTATGGIVFIDVANTLTQNFILRADANAGGGSGRAGPIGGAGGSAKAGDAEIRLTGGVSALNFIDVSARASGGSGGLSGDGDGGDGGSAESGAARLRILNPGTTVSTFGLFLDASANGGSGGTANVVNAGFARAGNGGAAIGGAADLRVTEAGLTLFSSEGIATAQLYADAFGGNGANGEFEAAGGGTGGAATGGSTLVNLSGGQVLFPATLLSANGVGGAGGFGIPEQGSTDVQRAATGTGTGGQAKIASSELNGPASGKFGQAQLSADGSGADDLGEHFAGTVGLSGFGRSGLTFATLDAHARGTQYANTLGIDIKASGDAITVLGNAMLQTDENISIDMAGTGGLVVFGDLSLSTGEGLIQIGHALQPATPVPTLSGATVSIASSGRISAGPDTLVRAAGLLSVSGGAVTLGTARAGGDAVASSSGDLVAGRVESLGGSVDLRSSESKLTVGSVAAATDAFLQSFSDLKVGDLAAQSVSLDAGVSNSFGSATITGTVAVTDSLTVTAATDVVLAPGADVSVGRNGFVAAGDDIIIGAGALLRGSDGPPPEAGYGGALLNLRAGAEGRGSRPFGDIGSLIVNGGIDFAAGTVVLEADAVAGDQAGGLVRAGNLYVDLTTIPDEAMPSDDLGQLRGQCLQGSVCLGSVSVTRTLEIGDGFEKPLYLRFNPQTDAVSVFLQAKVVELGQAGVTTSLKASDGLRIEAVGGSLALDGDISIASAGSTLIRAMNNISGTTASITTPGSVQLFAGNNVSLGTITADAIRTIDFDGTNLNDDGITADGRIELGKVSTGDDLILRAGTGVTLGTADLGSRSLDMFTKAGAARLLGGTAGNVSLEGDSVELSVTASGKVFGTAVNGSATLGIVSGSLIEVDGSQAVSFAALTSPDEIRLTSQGPITGGTATGGSIVILTPGTLTADALGTTLGKLRVEAMAGISLGTTQSKGATTLFAATGGVTVKTDAISSDGITAEGTAVALTGKNGLLVTSAKSTAGELTLVADAGSLKIGSASAKGDAILFSGGDIDVDTLRASGKAGLTAAGAVRVSADANAASVAVTGTRVDLTGADGLTVSKARATDGNVLLRTVGGTLSLGSAEASDSVFLVGGGAVAFGSLQAGSKAGVSAEGSISGGSVRAASFGLVGKSDVTLTGTSDVTGDVSMTAGGDFVFGAGAQMLADGELLVFATDDVRIGKDVRLQAARTTPPSSEAPLQQPAQLFVQAGAASSSLDGVGALTIGSGAQLQGRTVFLLGEAIQAAPDSAITANHLFVGLNNVPALGAPALDDDGTLAAACVKGNICLGAIDAVEGVEIGADGFTPNRLTLGGSLASGTVLLRSNDTLALSGNVTATARLALQSVTGDIALTSGTTVQSTGGVLSLVAGRDIAAAGANVIGIGDVGLRAGRDARFGTLSAAALRGADTGGINADLSALGGVRDVVITKSVTVSGALALTASGGIQIAQADASTIDLNAADAIRLGDARAASDLTLTSVSADISGKALSAGGELRLSARTGVELDTAEARFVAIEAGSAPLGASRPIADIAISGGLKADNGVNLRATGTISAPTIATLNTAAINAGGEVRGRTLTARNAQVEAGRGISFETVSTEGLVRLNSDAGAVLVSKDVSAGTIEASGMAVALTGRNGLNIASISGDEVVLTTVSGGLNADGIGGKSIALTVAGDLSFNQIGASGTLTVTAQGDVIGKGLRGDTASISAGRMIGADEIRSAGTLDLIAGEGIKARAIISEGFAALDGGAGAVTVTSFDANSGASITGTNVDLASLGDLEIVEATATAGDLMLKTALGDVVVGKGVAAGSIRVNSGASVSFTDLAAQKDITILSALALTGGTVSAGGTTSLYAIGALSIDNALTAIDQATGATLALNAANGLAVGTAKSSTGDLSLTASAGDLVIGTAQSAAALILDSKGGVSFSDVSATKALTLIAQADVSGGSATAASIAVITPGAFIADDIVATAGTLTALATKGVTLDTALSSGTTMLKAAQGTVTVASDVRPGEGLIVSAPTINLTGQTGLNIAEANATAGDLILKTVTGDLIAGKSTASGAINLDSAGALTFATLTAQQGVTLKAAGDVTGDGVTGTSVAITAGGSKGIALQSIAASGPVTLGATAGAIQIGNVLTNAAIQATARSIGLGSTGNILLTQASASDGDIVLKSNAGGITLGQVAASEALTADASAGTLTVTGTAAASSIGFTSADIGIGSGAQIGSVSQTGSITFTSTAPRSFVGGTGTAAGYRLDQTELSRVAARDGFTITTLPTQGSAAFSFVAPDQATIVLDSMTFTGAQLGSTGTFTVDAPRSIGIVGNVEYKNFAAGQSVIYRAGTDISLGAETGLVTLKDGAGALSGTLRLQAPQVIALSVPARAEVPNLTLNQARQRLGTNDAIQNDGGYFQAGTIDVRIGQLLFIQNSGANGSDLDGTRGFTGNTVRIEATGSTPAQVVVSGRVQTGGGFAAGGDLADNITLVGNFDPDSSFGGCALNAEACGAPPEEVTNMVFSVARDQIQDEEQEDEQEEAIQASQTRPDPVIQFMTPPSSRFDPLIDEPITGAGNDDLWGAPALPSPGNP